MRIEPAKELKTDGVLFSAAVYQPPTGCADPLSVLVDEAIALLKSSIQWVQYPPALCQRGAGERWSNRFHEVDTLNQKLLASVQKRGGVYALLTAAPAGNWTLRYVGQADSKGIRQRVRSHIVWRNKETRSGSYTGSKFDEVSSAVMNGSHVGFSFVAVEPPALRHYVEGELHRQFHPEWNRHGTTAAGQRASVNVCQWHRQT